MFRLLQVFCASALFIASIVPSWALAQTTGDPWDLPLNLSHSGVTVNPGIVIDSDGIVHTVWQDNLANFMYTRFDRDQWTAPAMTDLHRLFNVPSPEEPTSRAQGPIIYTGANPTFIAGPGSHIFAFWISAQGRLFTSKVRNESFPYFRAWESASVVAHEAASFAVAADALGEWHLAFLRRTDNPVNPAGIYYTRSKNGGTSWAVPVLLYQSPYLRRLVEGEANLSVATALTEDALRVFIAWDNRPRKQVFLAQSADGGASWEQPALVEGPAQDSGLAGPFNIQIGANQNSVVLVWNRGQPGSACNQIYQSSSDAGTTWSAPQPMIENLLGCTQSNEFLAGLQKSPEGPLYFLTKTQSVTYLSRWDGLAWSEPQEQSILAGFEEPEIFTKVDFGCHRASLSGERLYIIGCDEGEGGDVWITSRDLESDTPFAAPTWSQLSLVTSDNLAMESLELLSTEEGLIHAFFSQHLDPAIYYTNWNDGVWSPITPVLELPEGEAGWPTVATGPGNEFFLIAPNNMGSFYFSRAISSNALLASNWSTPTRLEIAHDGEIGSVDVAWDAAGTIYVAYSVPVNDERGIYLVQSKDHGTSWSEPFQVFDGAAADFDLVGAPSVLISEDDVLQITWKQQTVQGDRVPQSISLYQTQSEDGGRTFSDAAQVVEEPVAWREIVPDSKGNLHLLWQPQNSMTTVWDQVSFDGGSSWEIPQGLPSVGMAAAVTVDSAGGLHLVDAGTGTLGHWLWNGSRWQPEVPLHWSLTSQQGGAVELLAAAVNKEGKMVVVLAVPTGEGELLEKSLFYATRSLEIASEQTPINDVPTPTLLPPTLSPATPTIEHSSTLTGTVDSETGNSQVQTNNNETNDRTSPFAIALVPVALLLLGVLGFVIRRVIRVQDR